MRPTVVVASLVLLATLLMGGARAQPPSELYLPLVVQPSLPGLRLNGSWSNGSLTYTFNVVAGSVTRTIDGWTSETPFYVLHESTDAISLVAHDNYVDVTFLDDRRILLGVISRIPEFYTLTKQ